MAGKYSIIKNVNGNVTRKSGEFKKGKKKYNRKELYFGPILIKNKGKVFEEYNKRELERLSLVLKMLPKNKIIDRIKTKYMINLYNKI